MAIVHFRRNKPVRLANRLVGKCSTCAIAADARNVESLLATVSGTIDDLVGQLENEAASGDSPHIRIGRVRRNVEQIATITVTYGFSALEEAAKQLYDRTVAAVAVGLAHNQSVAAHVSAIKINPQRAM